MKVIKKDIEKTDFVPFKIEITFESQQEAFELRNILNHAWILDAIESDFNKIRDLLPNHNFQKFDNKLREIFKERLNL